MHAATALDSLPRPPCAELLGWQMIHARPAEGWVRVSFQGRPEFRNPAGYIQGGFLAAMLDDTMGPAVFVMTDGALYTVTIDMSVSYVAPAKVGPIYGEGRVTHLGKSIGFLEAELRDETGLLIARATSTAADRGREDPQLGGTAALQREVLGDEGSQLRGGPRALAGQRP